MSEASSEKEMSMVRRFLLLIAIYVFALIPAYSILAVLEGGARGLWHLSYQDWIYQGSAALVQAGYLFIAGGLIALPVITAGSAILGRVQRGPLSSAALAFTAVLLCAGHLAGGTLLVFPAAFLVSTGAYALVVFRIVRKGSVSPASAT